jgi:hypothetical protein
MPEKEQTAERAQPKTATDFKRLSNGWAATEAKSLKRLERVEGIEPSYSAWKAGAHGLKSVACLQTVG